MGQDLWRPCYYCLPSPLSQLFSRDGLPFRLMGQVLIRSAREDGKEKAGKAFLKAKQLRPDCEETMEHLIGYYLATRKLPEGKKACEEYLSTHRSTRVMMALAKILTEQRQYDEALGLCDSVLQLQPSNVHAEKLRKRLRRALNNDGSTSLDEDEEEDDSNVDIVCELQCSLFIEGAFSECLGQDGFQATGA
uniref:ER membrane protein complex subunit 2 n=1 Tax=Palpitomonas bilix TaxID=652834 RepID=A0A7S3CYU5_9EUKA|mmetsp:Transcript_15130/g.38225  ORF Transcript_15130/g.38225 Transcript_15130/m.38225 type:complete len:192 (+) Transcript_15130:66-641(+)